LGKRHGHERLREAVATALPTGCGDIAAVRYLLSAGGAAQAPLGSGELGDLVRYERPLAGVQDYDQLLGGEVVR